MTRTTLPIALAGVLALSACGDSSTPSEAVFDGERACRIGQRLVDETASGDRDGVISQIDRLDGLDGIDTSSLDVDDLDEIAEGLDANAVEDLMIEFEAIDCDMEAPDSLVATATTAAPETATDSTPTAEAAPVTDPPTTDPPATDPPPTDPPATDPPTTQPPASDPATSDAPLSTTPPAAGDAAVGVPLDIDSTGPGSPVGLDRPTEEIIADYGMSGILFSPNTNVVELTIDRSDTSYGGDPEWTRRDSITMSATTTMTLEDIQAVYRTAIEGLGVAYDFTESTSSRDNTRNVGLEASPSEFDSAVEKWDIVIGEDDEVPGVVVIEVGRYRDFDGTIPEIPGPAQELLFGTAQLGVDLGWTLASYRLNHSINSFSGGTYEFGSVRWDISEDDTMVAAADAMKAALGGGPFDNEETEDDNITWFLPTDDSPLFSIRYSEFSGTTASYTT